MKQSNEERVLSDTSSLNLQHSLVASRLTAELPAAIATILVAGVEAIATVQRLVSLKTATPRIGHIHYGLWQVSSEHSEQVVICCTSEQTVEIHCHGGPAICQAILNDLKHAGCHILRSDEFHQWQTARRPSLPCPIAWAAEQELQSVQTERGAAILIDQLDGALRSALEQVLEAITAGNVAMATGYIDNLLASSRIGLHLTTPWKIVLAGPPNVGKSSLSNALVGKTHAIVHHEPGTTRDWLQTPMSIDGWPVSLTDTAGIRMSSDAIETAGIARAHQQLRQADLVLLVIDGTLGWTDTHQQIFDAIVPTQTDRLIVWNKGDVAPTPPNSLSGLATVVIASSQGLPGVQDLIAALGSRLCPTPPKIGDAILFREEQVDLLREAKSWMVAGSIAEAQRLVKLMFAC